MQHTFFVHFFAVVLHDYNANFQKLLSYTFYRGTACRTWSSSLFFTAAHFHLQWWPLAFPIMSPLQNFHVVLPTKKCLRFFISRSKSLSPFFLLIFAGLPSTFSFSLTFSCSIFQMFGHDNIYLSLIL